MGPFWAILGPYSSCAASGAPFRDEMWGPVPEPPKRHFYIIDNLSGNDNPGDPLRTEMWGPLPETRPRHFDRIDNISCHDHPGDPLPPLARTRLW